MIYLGSDHRGYIVKEAIKQYLDEIEFKYTDCGTDSDERVDYPEFAKKVAQNVQKNKDSGGVLICGTGIGMSIVANKFRGIRCALCYDSESAMYSRLHNNSNILALSANIGIDDNIDILKTWLSVTFAGERHQDRLKMIEEIEDENFNPLDQRC